MEISRFFTFTAYRLSCPWSEASYPHLATPSTDSLSLVWTYRKNRLVNVPANLLVQGDVIVLGPGQKCPAKVQLVSAICDETYVRNAWTAPNRGYKIPSGLIKNSDRLTLLYVSIRKLPTVRRFLMQEKCIILRMKNSKVNHCCYQSLLAVILFRREN